jgi:2-polyprenyl-3-methyl-5-hydroxy-6-metoxy-1,4-benzoquinol methylase
LNNLTKDKWDKHYSSCSAELPKAADVLYQNLHLLPSSGNALDLACGRGANAVCLAENGLTVSAWDISTSALEILSSIANENKLLINYEARDIILQPPEPDSFDVIVISNFLERKLIDTIKGAVKIKGLIFYQTFIKAKVDEVGPKKPEYLLNCNELLAFFSDWNILHYKEEGMTGNTTKGFRNQAMLIAQKP